MSLLSDITSGIAGFVRGARRLALAPRMAVSTWNRYSELKAKSPIPPLVLGKKIKCHMGVNGDSATDGEKMIAFHATCMTDPDVQQFVETGKVHNIGREFYVAGPEFAARYGAYKDLPVICRVSGPVSRLAKNEYGADFFLPGSEVNILEVFEISTERLAYENCPITQRKYHPSTTELFTRAYQQVLADLEKKPVE